MAPRRAPGVAAEVVDGQAVLLDAAGTELFTLNEIGTRVWHALDGRRDAPDLAAALLPTFAGVGREQLEADIAAFLSELREAALVQDA